MSDDALRVAAIRAQGQRMVTDYDAGQPLSGKPVLVTTIRDLLAALAAAEAERDQARELVKYTLAERDQVRTERDKAQALVNAYRLEQQRQARIPDPLVERLAALEQAARIWVREHPPGHAGKYGGCAECEALGATALALDAPPGEATDGN